MSHDNTTYHRLFESANAAILVIDADFIFIDCNEMASKLLDRPIDEILGLTPDDKTISPEFQPNGRRSSEMGPEFFKSAMQGNDLRFEWTHLKKDGGSFPVEVSLFGFMASNKKSFFAMWRDLTEVKRKEIELEKHQHHLEELVRERTGELEDALKTLKSTQSQLVQSEKMASLGVMTSGIAHEINNPLNFILGSYTGLKQVLGENNINDSRVDKLLDILHTGVDRATNIVKGLTQLSGIQNGADENCDIHEIIDNCLMMIENQLEGRIEIIKHYYRESIYTLGNIGKLHQVFINILTNAVQAIECNGSVTISTNSVKNLISIEITDTGSGIDKEILSKIIDPFFTTKDPGKGTGLGLSIAYTIIKEHKGELVFDTKRNRGTTARISLPIN